MPETRPAAGVSVNHLVLNVRDIEASHRFYTEILGFEQCGQLQPRPSRPVTDMRFYRGAADHHHDLALVAAPDTPSAPTEETWSMAHRRLGINHIALAYPTREVWLDQLKHLKANNVEFLVRGNHGMTHSAYIEDPDGNGIEVLYEVPREVWEGDVDAALSYFEVMPLDGPEALEDSTDYHEFEAANS